jgi:hypothetical protein
MPKSFGKLLALLLCAAVLLGGGGIGSVFSGDLAHELGLERGADGAPSPCSNEGLFCPHGCTSHATAHLPALPSPSAVFIAVCPDTGEMSYGQIPPGCSLSDLLFRPPRLSLA